MRVVVTRPQHSGERTVRRLAQMGHEALLLPLAEPVHHVAEAGRALLSTRGAIAVTSAEAIRTLASLGADLAPHLGRRLFAVGKATAKEAADLGFSNVAVSEGGGAELATLISGHPASPGGNPLLYLAGSPRAPGFEAGLTELQLPFVTVECYRMHDITPENAVLRRLFTDARADAVLLYSRQTAQRFFGLPFVRQNPEAFTETRFLCLSEAIAEAVPARMHSQTDIADMPNEDRLLSFLIQA
ncbi:MULTISPECIES: uroporphyrinogen-III synthase [unclassified Rhizobium]|jgi:uroporphyrinogen-III synthase|uniref:uroporphyrinogen-III synthase n=1 Tax=unclassified Rhizobium TaxID=2613769 RepID=UPI000DDFF13C|nr:MULTISPECIES: uroporphyrinogen-III synthase [unclassified Rhizobium]MBB3286612.1 uroporphyrinogen-III synthase [Rhizobium sp. BK252]MBB3401194.1 uroporphyrinogen-III synthase [Rhizobium sp. BK289]MBB3413772.1 uroporphyrinogen-III synthase [Rhizobium sp. BK284]MBB3481659.1 uroporphyrinogen-III synthase [Rhizobium sp. BK347]MDK4719748.1 uroporphyrinogen-III synthase [Rhizobium sp. CNPSo 3968]